MADAQGNRYGPYDIEVEGSEAEPLTEANWFLLHQESGVVSGGALTFTGLTAHLAPVDVRVRGSFLVRQDEWTDTSPATTTSAPRRDMLVARRKLTSGEGVTAVPGKTFLTVLRGTPASTPAEPADYNPATDEPLWSWQVPGNGGTVVTGQRDYRRAPSAPRGIELVSDTPSGLVVPPNTPSPTAFTAANVVGLDRDGYLQAGSADHIKIPPGLGGVYGIGWGGNLLATPPVRHFWDFLAVTGSRGILGRRANGYGDTNACGFVELRLADLDVVKFQIYVEGSGPSSGNWPVGSRFLTCYRKGA